MPPFEMSYDEGIAVYEQAIDEAEAEIINNGLPVSSKPLREDGEFADFPRMPEDLSQVTFAQLQKLIGQFTAWFSFAIGQLKLAEGTRNAASKQREFAWSSIRKLKTGTVSDKDDAVRTDSRFIRVDARYENCDAKVRIYGAIVEGLKRDIDTVSRAATVLEARRDTEGKGVGVERYSYSSNARNAFRTARRRGNNESPTEQSTEVRSHRQGRALDAFKKRRKR